MLEKVLCLQEHEMDMLATFLGHDIRVHKELYRLPLDTMQVAKLSKVFMAAGSGKIEQYSGKTLSEIPPNATEEMQSENEESDAEEPRGPPSAVGEGSPKASMKEAKKRKANSLTDSPDTNISDFTKCTKRRDLLQSIGALRNSQHYEHILQ